MVIFTNQTGRENIWYYSPFRLVERIYDNIHYPDWYREYIVIFIIQTGIENI